MTIDISDDIVRIEIIVEAVCLERMPEKKNCLLSIPPSRTVNLPGQGEPVILDYLLMLEGRCNVYFVDFRNPMRPHALE